MDVFSGTDYKAILKHRIRARRGMTLKKLAARIPVQYTYLSRVLNRAELHLSEDHLFTVGRLLELYPEEMEFLTLLRAAAATRDAARRAHLEARIEQLQQARRLNASVQEFHSMKLGRDMGYLLDPLTVLVHVSLDIERYRANPRALCPLLGIDAERLRAILRKLAELELVEMESDGFTVARLLKGHIHYSTDHPLMRMHQNVMRSMSSAQLLRTEEKDKQSIMATFSADPETAEKIREVIRRTLREIEALAVHSRCTHTYQLGIDFFRWL